MSAKSARLFPGMLACRATYVEEPRAGNATPPVIVTLADGSRVTSDAPDCDDVLSAHFGRRVHLASAAAGGYTIDQYHRDVKDADPAGYLDTVVEIKLGSAFFSDIGVPIPVAPLRSSTSSRRRYSPARRWPRWAPCDRRAASTLAVFK